MKKRWLGSLAVLVAVLVAGSALAQMNPGPFHILHRQGAIYLRDVTGCWNYRNSNWEIWETGPGTIGGEHDYSDETVQYIEITHQIGTRIYGQRCEWEGFWECDPIEGTIIRNHVTIVNHDSDAECEWLTTMVGVVFWDETRGCWTLKGSYTGTDFTCTPPDQGYESAHFGSFEAWQGAPCPPPDPE